ncbi:MAG: ferredoxin [Anaerolineaceae bacterium]|jgi:ferredoxin
MRVRVDEDLCIGCGVCEGIVPEVFRIEHLYAAEVMMDPITEDFEDLVRQATEGCPEGAITLEEESKAINSETTVETLELAEEEAEESTQNHVFERNNEMKVTVDADLCIGCGICEGIVPEVFSLMNEPYAEVLLDPVPEEFQEATREAAEDCPEQAIAIEE